jgi:hypothetical protein
MSALSFEAEAAGIVGKLRDDLYGFPNLLGPAYGARFCDLAGGIDRKGLFPLELWLADRADISLTQPGQIKEPEGQRNEPGLFLPRGRNNSPLFIRNELRRRLGLPELSETEWPKGWVRCRMPPLDPHERAAVIGELNDALQVISTLEAAIKNRRPRDNEALKRTRKAARKLLQLCMKLEAMHAQGASRQAPVAISNYNQMIG